MEISLWEAGVLTLIGVIAGFLNVMAGGGSLLTVPVMVFMGIPGPVANGTNRIAILAQNLAAMVAFFRRGYSDIMLSLSLMICAIPGAMLGAAAGVKLDGPWFNRLLAVVMLAVMLIMQVDRGAKDTPSDHRPDRRQLVKGHVLMVGAGFWGGFIQIGVGFILMAILNRVMGLDLVRTNMHKVVIVAGYTVVALAIFASQVEILWLVGAALAIGMSVGGYLGAHFTVSRGEKLIRVMLNIVLVVFIVKLLLGF
jgi:uncharacterized membrane protein YfcA